MHSFLATPVKMLHYGSGWTPSVADLVREAGSFSSLPTCANDLKRNLSESSPAVLLQRDQPHGFSVVFSIKSPSVMMLPIPPERLGSKTEKVVSILQVLKLRIKDQADLPEVSW